MAISQASILEHLEKICSNVSSQDFIYDFLDAYGFPKSTITRLRNKGDSRNVGEEDDIALKKRIYFKKVDSDAAVAAETLKSSDIVTRNDIRFVMVTDFKVLVAYDLTAFLEAPVKILATMECYNLNPNKFESLIHGFLYAQRLRMTLVGKDGKTYHPTEWFSVSLEDAMNISRYIINGSIVNYRMNNTTSRLVRKNN